MKTFAIAIIVSFTLLARAADNLVDEDLAKNAVVVLRVKKFGTYTYPKFPNHPFTCYDVRVLRVFKNESNRRWADFGVQAFKEKEGVPSGECTIYLERYDLKNKVFNKTNGFWVLVGGDATNGVSHVDSNAPTPARPGGAGARTESLRPRADQGGGPDRTGGPASPSTACSVLLLTCFLVPCLAGAERS